LFDAFLKVLYVTDNSNDAEGTQAMLPISIGEVLLPKVQTSCGFVALFEDIYDGEQILTDFSVSIMCIM
jgi:hypothetical protein